MSERDRPDAYELPAAFEAYAPQSDHEATAAARAVELQRRAEVDVRAAEALTPRDRALLEAAFTAGARAALKRLRGIVGSAAVTVDAAALRGISEPHLDVRRPPPPFGPHRQLVEIVSSAAQLEKLHTEVEAHRAE